MATARRVNDLDDLKAAGILTAGLDVTMAEQAQAVVNGLLDQTGRIDILINNAGYGAMGPLAEMDHDELAAQFAVNVLGPMTLVRAVFPAMADAGGGMIVNIGSISGVASTPFAGAYCASKAAIHALSDSLRMELCPFGIQVVTVQPGAIASRFGRTAGKVADRVLKPDSRFAAFSHAIADRANISQQGAMAADAFAERLSALLMSGRPAPVIRMGGKSRLLPWMKRWLPTGWMDGILKKKFGLSPPAT